MGNYLFMLVKVNPCPLRWRHNESDGGSNHRLTIVCSTVYAGTDQRKHQGSASLAFVRGINLWQVNSPHKGPVTRKMFPFDDVIMPLRRPQCIDCTSRRWYNWTNGNWLIYMSVNWFAIAPENGTWPIRHQAIIWTNDGLLLVGTIWTNFYVIWISMA